MNIEVLKSIYLFRELEATELQKLIQIGQTKAVIAGQELFFSGQKSEALLVILKGSVRIFKSNEDADEIPLATISSGEHFGEMGFVTRDPRSATAQVVENADIFEVPYERLESLLSQEKLISEKFYRALSRFLAQRLKATTQELVGTK